MLYFVYVYNMELSDVLEERGERWCVLRACRYVVSYHDDAHEAWIVANDLLNNCHPTITMSEEDNSSVGAIPLCHDEHNLA